jgi:hypothetical protein
VSSNNRINQLSLNTPRKQFQIAGKGDDETLEIAIPVEHTRIATDSVGSHVPGNGGTCEQFFASVKVRSNARMAWPCAVLQKMKIVMQCHRTATEIVLRWYSGLVDNNRLLPS